MWIHSQDNDLWGISGCDGDFHGGSHPPGVFSKDDSHVVGFVDGEAGHREGREFSLGVLHGSVL